MKFFELLQEGGPTFMYTILLILLVCIFLIGKAVLKGDPHQKLRQLIHSLSLFALVWGFLGFMLGLIVALDSINAVNGDIHPAVLGGGIKVGLLSPSFGMITFLIARLGIVLLIAKNKK